MTITITRHIDEAEFWSSIMGSLEFYNEWWLKVKYLNGADWDKPGEVELTIMDENNKPLTKVLSLGYLVNAYNLVVSNEYHHCGTPVDIDNMDECSSDMVLQTAMLGDVVYG